jgi:hypothetical protein
MFPGLDFIHDSFHGFYNLLVYGFKWSPPITTCYVTAEYQNTAARQTRDNTRRTPISCFYYLTSSAYLTLCQFVFQTSYAILLADFQLLALLNHQLSFIYLLFCIYYGVEHYMVCLPKTIAQVPRAAMRLSFAKGLTKLGEYLCSDTETIEPMKEYSFNMPSGANVLEVKYYLEDSIDNCGAPLNSQCHTYTMNVKVKVHTYEMLPVVSKENRKEYIQERLKERHLVEKLILPDRSDPCGCSWIDAYKQL